MISGHKATLLVFLAALLAFAGLAQSVRAATPDPVVTPGAEPGQEDKAAEEGRTRQVPPSVAAGTTAVSDHFGYTLDSAAPYAWIDAAGGPAVAFPTFDDSFFGPVSLDFAFKFYENSYSQLYISTNGLVSFGEGVFTYNNQPLPQDTPPNALVAPFWDDLAVGGTLNNGSVHYLAGGSAPNRYFVIEWSEVTRRFSSGLLTFEVVLYENGDILFQYQDMNGIVDQASAGIEDAEGFDGLLHLYNASGLADGQALRFTRPLASPRVKLLPGFQSAFVANSQASFQVTARNIGETGADVYDLVATSSNPAWQAEIYEADGQTPLADHNSNGLPDTGSIAQGAEKEFTITLRALHTPQSGDYTRVTLTARSAQDSQKQASTQFLSAAAVPFAQAFADSNVGINLHLIGPNRNIESYIEPWFSGSNMALGATANGSYLFAWERNGTKLVNNQIIWFSDIEYILLNMHGAVTHQTAKLTNNAAVTLSTTDRSPSMATSADGKIGVLFTNLLEDDTLGSKGNIYFAILNSQGQVETGPLNVTNNTQWRDAGTLDVPLFNAPQLTASGDAANPRFTLTWVDERLQGDGSHSNIAYAVYDTAGGVVHAPALLTAATVTQSYFTPMPIPLNGNRVFVAYNGYNETTQENNIHYAVLGSAGNVLVSPLPLAQAAGTGPDGIQLNGGNLLLAWAGNDGKTTYTVLDGSNYTTIQPPTELTNPAPRLSNYVSVTQDPYGNGVLTWMDGAWNNYLFYAAVDNAGNEIIPPMIFYTGQSANPLVLTSYAGLGNAPYWVHTIFTPLIRR